MPSNLVRDSIDLSKHHSNVLSQSFEEIFTTEELLPIVSELEENTSALLNQGSTLALFPIPVTSCACHDSNPVGQQAIVQDNHINTLCDAESTFETQSQKSTLVPQGTKPRSLVCTHAKRHLTDMEISYITQSLIQGDSIDFFISDY